MYHNRDFRRKYPQTDVITQQYLTELLLAVPNEDGTKRYVMETLTRSLPVPGSEQTTSLTVPTDLASPTAFTQVLEQVQMAPENKYSASNLPPSFPSTKTHHVMKLQKDAIPHGKYDYFPVYVKLKDMPNRTGTTTHSRDCRYILVQTVQPSEGAVPRWGWVNHVAYALCLDRPCSSTHAPKVVTCTAHYSG